MERRKIHLVSAARPNFMKITPLWIELKKHDWADTKIVHTGQHYDANMSDDFFNDLGMPEPHIHLGVGSGSHAEQTGRTLIVYEKVLLEHKPDLVVVVGDVNATVAASLAASKLNIKVAHLEAGLRSFDWTMPEEINRVLTDSLADLLWTPSPDADENLLINNHRGLVVRVGNIMIDSLELMRPKIEQDETRRSLNLNKDGYMLVTLHRPSNVDDAQTLSSIVKVLNEASSNMPLIFPVHPRTRKMLVEFGLWSSLEKAPNIKLLEPLSYIPFMNVLWDARMVITDSGGIQEETTYLGIPCFTLRPNTERPITITEGTNRLCKPDELHDSIITALHSRPPKKSPPDLWDGHTAERVAESIETFLAA